LGEVQEIPDGDGDDNDGGALSLPTDRLDFYPQPLQPQPLGSTLPPSSPACYVTLSESVEEKLTVLTTDCDAKQCWNDWKKCEEETAYLKLVIRSLELPQNTKDLEFNVFESESYRIEAKKDDILSKLLTPFNITAKEEDMKLSLKMLLDYTDALDLQEHIPVILKELAQNNVRPWDLMFVGRGYIPRLRKVDTCKYQFEWSN